MAAAPAPEMAARRPVDTDIIGLKATAEPMNARAAHLVYIILFGGGKGLSFSGRHICDENLELEPFPRLVDSQTKIWLMVKQHSGVVCGVVLPDVVSFCLM